MKLNLPNPIGARALHCVEMFQARTHKTVQIHLRVVIRSPLLSCADAGTLHVGTSYLPRGILPLCLTRNTGQRIALRAPFPPALYFVLFTLDNLACLINF